MVQLRVLHRYANNREAYEKHQEFEADDEHAKWLLADAPGCFEVIEPKPDADSPAPRRKRLRKPPENKAVQAPPEEK